MTKKLTKYFLILCLIISVTESNAQTSEEELAYYYYENSEYEKANLYLKKVYENNTTHKNFNYYFNTLLEVKEYKDAIRLAENKAKENNTKFLYQTYVAIAYEKMGKAEKAEKVYNDIIDSFNKESRFSDFSSVGSRLTEIGKLDLALKTYEKGEASNKNTNLSFGLQIAEIYGRKGNFDKMSDAYLDMLDKNERLLNQVQSYIPRTLNFETDTKKVEELKIKLLKRIQQNPNKTIFNEMLIWLFQQKGDFNSAFIQVKALDKRKSNDALEVYKFAGLCTSNKQYDLAVKAYDYILTNFKPTNYYYNSAERQILSVLKTKITINDDYDLADLKNLKSRYIKTINSTPNYRDKNPLMLDLANLEAYYIHNIDTAEIVLNSLLASPGLDKKLEAETKIEKADLLLIQNQIWEASLLYMQVEKQFKHDIIGSAAKFKNAKLYYYTGDYEWCQNQLNALKASTSKLISNNAIDLSLLITDNYNMDTSTKNMLRFSEADLLLFQNKLDEAILKLDSINLENPTHSLSDEILYKRYEIVFKRRNFTEAVGYLNKIIEDYKDDILADNALFKSAELYENQLNNKEKAKEYYSKLLFDYPGSLFVVEARKRYRELTGNEMPVIKTIEE
jgi:tetratricopeptide (TPR) repeat protein